MDVQIWPTTVPSASIQQFALVSPIRILGISDEKFKSKAIQAMLKLPGRTIIDITKRIYDNQINEKSVRSIGSCIDIGSKKGLDADLVYNMMKTL
jgi:hypothetical protein